MTMIKNLRSSALRASVVSTAFFLFVGCGSTADDSSASDAQELAGSPNAINIGFNGGPDQFAFVDEFWNASSVHPGPRLCHTYPSWNVALQHPGQGSVTLPGSRAWFENWLRHAEGHCDEALVSFKSYPRSEGGNGNEPPHTTSRIYSPRPVLTS